MNFPELDRMLRERLGEDPAADYGRLHSPLLLPDMGTARDRVIQAMRAGEHICVYADYDADGIPGAVVFSDFFKRVGYDQVSFYIPHRHDEGFGLNQKAIDEIAERGTKLLITVDCGTADAAEVEHANRLGLDVIVTDHHESLSLPPALAIVNPKRSDSAYPFRELCGAAVAFKLVQAILEQESFGLKDGLEKWSLDMVGSATLSDCVPLVGENRILARFGLEVLRKTRRPGLRALFDSLRMDVAHLTEDDIAFMITPRINAASRMGVPLDAFHLLASDDPIESARLAGHLESINRERKGLVAALVKEAKGHLEHRTLRGVIVVGSPDWRPALAGLVANALVEAYDRPVFVWGRDGDGVIKGSCRGPAETDLFALMSATSEHFLEFGGHRGAGGFSVGGDRIHFLEEALATQYAETSRDRTDPQPEEALTVPLTLSEVGEDLWEVVGRYAPFGTGNEKPVFSFKAAEVQSVRQFGKAKEHLEVVLGPGRGVKAISFFTAPEAYAIRLESGSRVNLQATLEKSYFMNRPELRLRIVDITA